MVGMLVEQRVYLMVVRMDKKMAGLLVVKKDNLLVSEWAV